MFWALTNVPDDKIHVMGEQTSQALVTSGLTQFGTCTQLNCSPMWRLLWCWGVCAHASARKETRGMSETNRQVIE